MGDLPEVRIVEYRDEWKDHFKSLNVQWLEEYFEVEEYDALVLGDPQKYIINAGGEILFAEYEGEIVGTVALMKDGDTFEITKMGVRPDIRGRNIGKKLMNVVIERARKYGVDNIYLLTSTKLEVACKLYKKMGFVQKDVSAQDQKKYRRSNTRFEFSFVTV